MNTPSIPTRVRYIMSGGNSQRWGSPWGLPDTYPSEYQRGKHKIGTHRSTPISHLECGVLVVEPWSRLERTPRAENDKQGLRSTDRFRVCATTQPGQLPAYHGKRPIPSAQKWKFPTKSSAVSKMHCRWRIFEKANNHVGGTILTVPTGGTANRIHTSVHPYHPTAFILDLHGDIWNRPRGKWCQDDEALRLRGTPGPIDRTIGKGEIIITIRGSENF